MQTQASAADGRGMIVARGFGLKIRVEQRHLVIEDGSGRDRRTRRFHRASGDLRRLIVHGRTGYLTLEALSWLADVRAAVVFIDADGRLTGTSSTQGRDIPALRRAQALATANGAAVEISRDLLRAKVSGQQSLLGELPGGERARFEIARALQDIERARTLPELLTGEAQAAAAYWQAWGELPVTISVVGAGARSIPEHWRTFGHRRSLLSGNPRTATNPANALLNYAYALLEAETTIACRTVGLDPGLGFFHTDKRDRDSLTLDAMEPARPAVDAYVLALLSRRTLTVRDFGETRQGACRLTTEMASRLAETIPAWGSHVAPHVEQIAHRLRPSDTSAPLTRNQHHASWEKRSPNRTRAQPTAGVLALPATCRDCGGELPSRRHRYCEDCRRAKWVAQAERGRQNAAQVLDTLRAEQRDPRHGGNAAKLRGEKNRSHQFAVRAWAGETPDPERFAVEILPGLREIPIPTIAAAAGISPHYASLIRLGKRVPHARHWEALRGVSVRTVPHSS